MLLYHAISYIYATMIKLVIPFAMLWTLSTADKINDYYYYPTNVSRSTPSGIAAYRSALTLDWLSAEDSRQREMVAAIESEPLPLSRISHSDCISYARPPSGTVARLILEMLKNLEGDDGQLIPRLIHAMVRAKLLVLETAMFENEPDLDALVKTPTAMMGEPHTTFPRIIATLWLAVTDPSTVKKHGWCTVNQMTTFLSATKPSEIAEQMRAVEPIVARARFIMEEFIQHVTPLNMLQQPSPNSLTNGKFKHAVQKSQTEHHLNYKRPVRTQPEMPYSPEPRRTEIRSDEDTQLGMMPKFQPHTFLQPNVITTSFSTLPRIYNLLLALHLLVL